MSDTMLPEALNTPVGGVNNPLNLSGASTTLPPPPPPAPLPAPQARNAGGLQSRPNMNGVDATSQAYAQSYGNQQTAGAQAMAQAAEQQSAADHAAVAKARSETKPIPAFVPTKETASDLSMIFGMLGVLGTALGGKAKTAGMEGMAAMTGMMQGYQQGRQDLYEKEYKQFQTSLETMKAHNAEIQQELQYALKLSATDMEKGKTYAQLAMARLEAPVMQAKLQHEGALKTAEHQHQIGLELLRMTNQARSENTRYQHQVASQAPQEVTLPDGTRALVQATVGLNGKVTYQRVEGYGPVVKQPAIGLGAVQVRDNMTPEARVIFDKAVAAAGPSGLDPQTQKNIRDSYASISESNEIAKYIASRPDVVGVWASVSKTLGDRLNSLNSTVFRSDDDKFAAQQDAVGSTLADYAKTNPSKASQASEAIVMSKRLFGLALADAQSSPGRVTVYLERILSGFYDPRLTPESLIGTIKGRSDEVDARLNGLYVGTNTQRNRDERFPLNAAPSALDFMKKFSPESDKPGASSAVQPAAGGGTALKQPPSNILEQARAGLKTSSRAQVIKKLESMGYSGEGL